jgi:lipoic acid synthetase
VSSVAPEGRKLLRLEVRNSRTPVEQKPEWMRTRVRTGPGYTALQSLVRQEGLQTVCQEAVLRRVSLRSRTHGTENWRHGPR